VLRDALRPHLPAGLLDRPKQGFAAPLGGALRARMGEVRATLLGPAMLDQGFFDDAALRRLLDEHEAGRFDHGQALWQLLVLEGFFAQEATPSLAHAVNAP